MQSNGRYLDDGFGGSNVVVDQESSFGAWPVVTRTYHDVERTRTRKEDVRNACWASFWGLFSFIYDFWFLSYRLGWVWVLLSVLDGFLWLQSGTKNFYFSVQFGRKSMDALMSIFADY